ncbi:MAG: DUF2092 domain-containing protein [Planctomycetota bacterium]|jgi:hypothetical protein
MRRVSSRRATASGVVALTLLACAGAGPPDTARIEAKADRVLKEMGAQLAAATEFSFHADITYDAPLASGQTIQRSPA